MSDQSVLDLLWCMNCSYLRRSHTGTELSCPGKKTTTFSAVKTTDRDAGDECACPSCEVGIAPENYTFAVPLTFRFIPDPALPGIGGAPTRATTLPIDAAERKQFPVASGFMDYFPDAIVALSNLSKSGSDQHNPGKPLFWDRSKSTDEPDTCLRHFLQRGTLDIDGKRHTVKFAWRALAILQKEIEEERNA